MGETKVGLTDEEIDGIDTTGVYDYFQECEKRECIAGNSRESGFDCEGRYLLACEYHKRTVRGEKALIAEAQLKKVVEWGEADCPHKKAGWHTPRWRSECPGCWQALLEEVKE